MQNLTNHITSIEEKVRLVVQKIEELKAENTVLKQQNERLQEELQGQGTKQGMEKIISTPSTNSEGKYEEIKKELDHYIEEIDQTIQLLKAS